MIRPTIEELHDFEYDYLDYLYKTESSNDGIIIPTTSDSNNNDDNNLQQIHKSHPLAYHSSRILDDDIARYESLQHDLELCLISETISETGADEGKLN